MKVLRNGGFTLIEIVIVVSIIGFLAAIAIPKFQDLQTQAKVNSAKAALGAVRSTLVLRYAASSTGGSSASFPSSLASSDFAGATPPFNPYNSLRGVTALTTTTTGTATSTDAGFWYVTNTTAPDYGKAGAYSDGSTNTSSW